MPAQFPPAAPTQISVAPFADAEFQAQESASHSLHTATHQYQSPAARAPPIVAGPTHAPLHELHAKVAVASARYSPPPCNSQTSAAARNPPAPSHTSKTFFQRARRASPTTQAPARSGQLGRQDSTPAKDKRCELASMDSLRGAKKENQNSGCCRRGTSIPKCLYASGVATRPRCVRSSSPSCIKYGS